MRIKLITVIFCTMLITACGHKEVDPQPSKPNLEQLQDKREDYLKFVGQVQDKSGFIETDECDSLMFSGLLGAAGATVDMLSARDSNGQWYRRPLMYPKCWDSGGSKSQISQDGILGLAWWLWRADYVPIERRRQVANDLLAYGKAHDWVMGEGDKDLTSFPFFTQAVIAELAYRLGGTNDEKIRGYINDNTSHLIFIKGLTGYRAHLQVLMILILGEMKGSIDGPMMTVLGWQRERQPDNALFQYGFHKYDDGDQTETLQLCLNIGWWPSDRLPAEKDRECHWLFERDNDSDWLPGTGSKVWSGGDLLFISMLLTNPK